MNKPHLVLDFDGTLTDICATKEGFENEFAKEFRRKTGVSLERLAKLRSGAEKTISEDPRIGWMNNGLVVASANSDPYIYNSVLYGLISEGMDLPKKDDLIVSCFRFAYESQPVSFRSGIKLFLEKAKEKYEVSIITNSRYDKVFSALQNLSVSGINLTGNAKKFSVDPSWNEVNYSIQPKGFPRPVMLRRKEYFDALTKVVSNPEETTVVGDIYELDLSLPDYLGMNFVQLVHSWTPRHEIDYVSQHKRGSIASNLEGVERILKLRS